ncbi:alpha/beta hydrolase [Rhodobacterales bacterium]|nr:alpha/beta hydrolase [Rhodobacterales bacterium]
MTSSRSGTGVPTAEMQEVLQRLAVEDAGLGDPTLLRPDAARKLAEHTNRRWNTDLPDMADVVDFEISSGGAPAVSCRLLSPEDARGLIIFIHGGGWALCSMQTHERAARLLALEAGAHVLTFDYRLAPDHPFPQGLEDCLAVYGAVTAGETPLGSFSGPLALAGDSAGANLALAVLFRLQSAGRALPDAALLFYGVYGANFETPSYSQYADGPGLTRDKMRRYWNWYVPRPQDRAAAEIAPLQARDEQLQSLPPLYLNAAEIDPLRSDTELLVERLRALGRTDEYRLHRGVVHGFMQMSLQLAEARTATQEAGRTFRALTGTEPI